MKHLPNRTNLLFVCSRNRWRSPTAEKVFQRDQRVDVRSCGTSRNAKQTIRQTDISWADIVMVMEQKHKQRLLADFPDAMKSKEVHVLDIPDEYRFMDPQLIELIQTATEPLLPM